MTEKKKRFVSLSVKPLFVLLLGLVLGVCMALLAESVGEAVIERCYLSEAAVLKRTNRAAQELQGYVRQAVRAENEAVGRLLVEQTGRLIDAMRRIVPKDVLLDTGALVGELTPAIDEGLNVRYRNAGRGNVR